MLKKIIRFIRNCNNFVNVYSKKIDEIEENVNSLSNDFINAKNNVKDDLLKMEEQINNLDYVNLEYINLHTDVSKNRVLIVGFYGAPNLGDELMLFSILKKLSPIDSGL